MIRALPLPAARARREIGWDWAGSAPAAIIAILVGLAVLTPLGLTVLMSFKPGLLTQPAGLSLEFYRNAWGQSTSFRSLGNTVLFAAGTTLVALLFGVPLAFLAERTDFRLRHWLLPLMTVKIVMPVYITAMAWILLLSPKIGLINSLLMGALGLDQAPFSIYSLGGMAMIQGLSLASVTFFILSAIFRAMDSTLEEAAHMSGVGMFRTFLRINLPLARPALLGAAIYVFMIGMGSFEVPAIIGLPQKIFVLSTEIYTVAAPTAGLPDYNTAAAFGAALLLAGLVLMWTYWRLIGSSRRYAVVTGRARRTPMRLGAMQPLAGAFLGLYLLLALGLPFLALLWISLSPYVQPVSIEAIESLTLSGYAGLFAGIGWRPVLNTLLLILVAPIGSIVLAFAVSWIATRTRFRWRSTLDTVAFLPHATSSTLMAVSFGFAFLSLVKVVPIYGSIWSIAIVVSVLHLPFAVRSISAAMIQIHPELEEAGKVSGVRPLQVVTRVLAPLVLPVLVNVWLWLWLVVYREVTVPVLLSSPSNEVLSTVIWRLWRTADFARASALGVVVILAALVLMVGARRVIARATPAALA
jgi:iron(III) transport system permease protein